ncbi:MAG: FeoB-associated Cys-rich membrane protein [Bacillota bacterium]|nr:FeoB-associated Cys-rich membrane protein [Bacillota bacterium]
MTATDIIILIISVLIVGWTIFRLIRKRKNKGSETCGHCCSGCVYSGTCNSLDNRVESDNLNGEKRDNKNP